MQNLPPFLLSTPCHQRAKNCFAACWKVPVQTHMQSSSCANQQNMIRVTRAGCSSRWRVLSIALRARASFALLRRRKHLARCACEPPTVKDVSAIARYRRVSAVRACMFRVCVRVCIVCVRGVLTRRWFTIPCWT